MSKNNASSRQVGNFKSVIPQLTAGQVVVRRVSGWSQVVAVLVAIFALGSVQGGVLAITGPLCALVAALSLAVAGPMSNRRRLVLLSPAPFLALGWMHAMEWSPVPWLARQEIVVWTMAWLMFVAAASVGGGGEGRRPASLLLAGATIGVGLAVYQYFADPEWLMLGRLQAEQYVGRAAGPFGSPNSFAALLVLLLPVSLAWVTAPGAAPAARVAAGYGAAALITGLVLTGSRGGWIAGFLVLAAFPLATGGRPLRRFFFGAGTVVLLGAVALAAWTWLPRVQVRARPFLDGEWEASRPVIWQAAWAIFREHPWTGGGLGSYSERFNGHRPEGFLLEPVWAHNDYLNVLADLGVAGAALALLAAVTIGWAARLRTARINGFEDRRDRVFRRAWGLGLAGFMVHASVDFHFYIPSLVFTFAWLAGTWLPSEPPSPSGRSWSWFNLVLALLALIVGWELRRVYQPEGIRVQAREAIDRIARDRDAAATAPEALADWTEALERAAVRAPSNGALWAELAHAWQSRAYFTPSLHSVARDRSLEASGLALACSELPWEFWVRRGIALDMADQTEPAADAFLEAVRLNPHGSLPWYYYAHHLSRRPGRRGQALATVGLSLRLDPQNVPAQALRQRLLGQ